MHVGRDPAGTAVLLPARVERHGTQRHVVLVRGFSATVAVVVAVHRAVGMLMGVGVQVDVLRGHRTPLSRTPLPSSLTFLQQWAHRRYPRYSR